MGGDGELEDYIETIVGKVGLDKVWVIDDEFNRGINSSDLQAALETKDESHIKGFCRDIGFDFSEVEDDKDELIAGLVSHCMDSDKKREKLESFLGLGKGGAEAFGQFWDSCGLPCPVERIAPNDASEELRGVQDDSIGRLIVVDLNLKHANMGPYGGAHILEDIDPADNHWGVLISQDFNGGREVREREFDRVIGQVSLDRRAVVPIAKDDLVELDEGPSLEIVILLLSALMAEERDSLIETLDERMDKGIEPTVNAIGRLAPHEFAQAIVWSGITDGTPPAETLTRILQGDYRRQVHSVIKQDDIRRHLRGLTAWKPPDNEDLPSPEFQGVRKLLRSQRVDSQEWLAEIRARLRLGDIFVSEEMDRPYILLEQPCDLALRSDGDRNLKMGRMFPLRPVPHEEGNREDGRYLEIEGLHGWQYLDLTQQEIGVLDFKQESFIDLAVLDTTTISGDGQARIDLGEENELQDVPLRKRAEQVRRLLREKKEGCGGPDSFETYLKALGNSKLSELPMLNPSGSLDGEVLEFQIQRVGRLRRNWAMEALSSWARYKTRRAFPVSMDRGLG